MTHSHFTFIALKVIRTVPQSDKREGNRVAVHWREVQQKLRFNQLSRQKN